MRYYKKYKDVMSFCYIVVIDIVFLICMFTYYDDEVNLAFRLIWILGFALMIYGFVFIWLAVIFRLIKSDELSAELSKTRKIICEGSADVQPSFSCQLAGWMVLSVNALEFYAFNLLSKSKNLYIGIDDIESVATKGNHYLIINTKYNKHRKYYFYVDKAKVWKNNIQNELSRKQNEESFQQ